ALGHVSDDLSLELPSYAVAVRQRADPADADGFLEERIAAPFGLRDQSIQRPETWLQVADHLVVERRDLPIDVLDGGDVVGEHPETSEGRLLVGSRQAQPHVERVEELETDSFLLRQRVQEVVVDAGEAAGPPSPLPVLLG